MNFLMNTLAIGTVLISASHSYADVCSSFMNATLGVESSAASVENGKLAIDAKSEDYLAKLGDDSAKIKMTYFIGDEEVRHPTVIRFQKTAETTTVSRRADSSVKLQAADLAGFEARYLTATKNQCEMLQNVAIFRSPQGELKRLIFDKKYCDTVRGIVGARGATAEGMKALGTCTETLGDIQEAFNKRREELQKDGIMMSDSATPMGNPFMSAEPQNAAGLALGLMSLCTPQGWDMFVANTRNQITRGVPQKDPAKTAK